MKFDITRLVRLMFIFLFVSMGMSALILGLIQKEWLLIILGAPITVFINLPLLRGKPLAVLVTGLSLGVFAGLFVGDLARFLFGVIGGVGLGMLIGLVFAFLVLLIISPGVHIGLHILQGVPIVQDLMASVFALGMILGGAYGLLNFREGIAILFGSFGSGVMLGWVSGVLAAYRIKLEKVPHMVSS